MQNLKLISIWKARRQGYFHVNYHSHKYYELVYYTYGNGQTTIEDSAYRFSDNCFSVIPFSAEHDETHFSDSEVICLEFSGVRDLPIGFYKDSSLTVHRILTDLLNEVKEQDYGYDDMMSLKLNELLLYILRKGRKASDTKNFEYIINCLRENFHEKIVLSTFAEQLNISYDYFRHRFKAITGLSPQRFLTEQRLLAAEHMLKTGTYNCTEISYLCGICTSAQFSALFKKKYGVTPLQFRKTHG